MLRALTFDYWDTLYEGGALPERVALRRTAVGALLGAYGRNLPEEDVPAPMRQYIQLNRDVFTSPNPPGRPQR